MCLSICSPVSCPASQPPARPAPATLDGICSHRYKPPGQKYKMTTRHPHHTRDHGTTSWLIKVMETSRCQLPRLLWRPRKLLNICPPAAAEFTQESPKLNPVLSAHGTYPIFFPLTRETYPGSSVEALMSNPSGFSGPQ